MKQNITRVGKGKEVNKLKPKTNGKEPNSWSQTGGLQLCPKPRITTAKEDNK